MGLSGFNELIHAPNRLQICALLVVTAEMEFKAVKLQLNVSDSVLSKHMKALVGAGYIAQIKRTRNGRPCTWFSITEEGRQQFEAHVKALREIVGVGP
ncbi:winged helix-turn-helix domain-containing protein [Glaciecola petra]|uniref:Transcriptional regulator n=1 Tax=Glaciecola petra TaxID=3075602 RepID=A0ABU2ZU52_9ALTE|nr:transcriptional regulator [Aestuariibacter sp. P117]MDT0595854.1 transcriptional regulator [Aestuariibacter sp. P117]